MRYTEGQVVAEPVDEIAAREWLRRAPDDDSEDVMIRGLISAARVYAENYTGRAICTRAITAYPERFESAMRLPRPPVAAITRITYRDIDGQTVTMPETDYTVDGEIGELRISEIPQAIDGGRDPITIEYEAGYGLQTPETLITAIKMMLAHWDANREAAVTGNSTFVEIGLGARNLLNQYKVWWF